MARIQQIKDFDVDKKEWQNRQIINDDICLLFYLSFILWLKHKKHAPPLLTSSCVSSTQILWRHKSLNLETPFANPCFSYCSTRKEGDWKWYQTIDLASVHCCTFFHIHIKDPASLNSNKTEYTRQQSSEIMIFYDYVTRIDTVFGFIKCTRTMHAYQAQSVA